MQKKENRKKNENIIKKFLATQICQSLYIIFANICILYIENV